MARSRTPSFVVELPLRYTPADRRRLLDRGEVGKRLTNVMLQDGRAVVARMRADPAWAAARSLPKATEAQRRARGEAFQAVRRAHGFTQSAFETQLIAHKNQANFASRIGAHETQKIAERVFAALHRWVLGVNGRPRFKGRRRPLHSLEGKNNTGMLQWVPETKELQLEKGWRLSAVLPALDKDEWLWSALQARTKYCRLVWRRFRGEKRWFVQLIQEGRTPLKAALLEKLAAAGTTGGLDIGPSTLAWVTPTDAGLVRFCADVDRPHALIRRLSRHIDRQRRANNPDNYEADGRCKKGARVWHVSRRQRQAEAQLSEQQRHEAAVRKNAHGRLLNQLLSQARSWRDDGVSPKALQQCYGRSVSVRAPGQFMTRLERKVERTGGTRQVIDVRVLKNSQYDHTTDDFEKKKLSERWHVFRDGRGRVQRDVYSAFLALHAEETTYQPPKLERAWGELASALLRAGWFEAVPKLQAVPLGAHAGTSSDVRAARSQVLCPPSELAFGPAPGDDSGTHPLPGLCPAAAG